MDAAKKLFVDIDDFCSKVEAIAEEALKLTARWPEPQAWVEVDFTSCREWASAELKPDSTVTVNLEERWRFGGMSTTPYEIPIAWVYDLDWQSKVREYFDAKYPKR